MKRLYYWYDENFCQHKIIAKSQSDVKRQLLCQGKIAIKIQNGVYITSTCFSRAELLIITKQLATMLKAGLPIVDSLHLIAEEHPKPSWQYLLDEIKQKIAKGESLSLVLTQYKSIFSSLYCEIVATGELTGQLDICFEQLVIQLEKSIQLQKKIKKAMRYPLFLLFVSIVVALVMLLVVLPKFSDVYQSFDVELPFFTQCLINVSDYLQQHWFILATILIIFRLLYQYYLKPRYQVKIDVLLIKCPLLGHLIQTSCLTQIFQTLALTQQAGIPLLSGLKAATHTAYNNHYRQNINQIVTSIKQGNSFSYALKKQIIFPALCYQLIHAGEESGTLDLMLDKLAHYYQEQNEELTDKLSQKFEPVLMMVLAVIIGGLIIAMYLPIFQLGNVIR